MAFDLGKLLKFIFGVLQQGHEAGLWDKGQAQIPGTEDHAKFQSVMSGTDHLFEKKPD